VNHRILELAEHCDFYVGNEHSDASHEEQQRLFLEKFAQLIVQECIGIVENYPSWYGDYRDQIENAFRGHLLAKMKYHFGIEE